MNFESIDMASNRLDSSFDLSPSKARSIMSEDAFKQALAIERKRSERSKESFLLMLLKTGDDQGSKTDKNALNGTASALLSFIRETDLIGWYSDKTTVGVIFTALGNSCKNFIVSTVLKRVSTVLEDLMTCDQFNRISISFHYFPDEWDRGNSGGANNPALYPDLSSIDENRKSLLGIKRGMDIAGSLLMLILCAPLLLMIALAIKTTSKGPVLFKQERVGQHGRHFTFLKFRSMYIDNDPNVHKQFVTRLIASGKELDSSKRNGKCAYKLTNDNRITRVGRVLRQTSLDEMPQFLNVLIGDMALVGPRPPIPYELAAYQTWHRRRLLEVKPGITGLWQVTGRSRVKFDEMVRLDLRYATSWSPWLDLRILLRTPLAVIKGEGAC